MTGVSARAQVVVDVAHCRAYEALEGDMTWEEARAAASARVYDGVPGYLAVVTSQHETDFLFNAFGARESYAIGGIQTGGPEPDGGWAWITGEAWDYTNWNPGEPNNVLIDGQPEDRLAWSGAGAPRWNDVAGDINQGPDLGQYRMDGYLVEYELREPCCPPDLTGEGDVNTNDFFLFLSYYQSQDPRADFSPGGGINTNDFFAYLAAYQAGC